MGMDVVWGAGAALKARVRRVAGLLGAVVLGMSVTACGGVDSVELNGGVFDALGVSGNLLTGSTKEAELRPRPGLVVPPDNKRLPVPGSERVAAAAPNDQSWPVGPEDSAAQKKAKLQAEHDSFCKKALERQRTLDPDGSPPQGPLGPCEGGIANWLFGLNKQQNASQQAQ